MNASFQRALLRAKHELLGNEKIVKRFEISPIIPIAVIVSFNKGPFLCLLQEKYESEVEIVNFATDSKTIEGEVNEWVASKTNDMIKQLLSPGTLTADTVLVLLNAIYFKGKSLEQLHRRARRLRSYFRVNLLKLLLKLEVLCTKIF